jgi:hypothetical protein
MLQARGREGSEVASQAATELKSRSTKRLGKEEVWTRSFGFLFLENFRLDEKSPIGAVSPLRSATALHIVLVDRRQNPLE